ncbi:MAG: DUF1294 domain-containing protein [Oscillospiraceae bacterium]|nr:DUF1294 domain-containing protein [Oscillospiraceae bacterium]
MTTLNQLCLCYLLVVNLVGFTLYGIDKWQAEHGRWRIEERTLLLTAALGGAVGALVGMKVWNHKIRKLHFAIFVPLCVVVWGVLVALVARK